MSLKQHGRQYDLVVFGATGYTGKYTAEYIASELPTNLRWAVAGRSQSKLEEVVEKCKALQSDRRQPGVEICSLDPGELAALAKKTYILISTVGPYGSYGEHAFKACAESGTHYFDCTGEVPFVAGMIAKYEKTAKSTGAAMFPQIGIESAPPDLVTWSLAAANQSEFKSQTRDVTVAVRISSLPSGGTLATALSVLENFTLKDFIACRQPFALSPIPNSNPAQRAKPSLLTRLMGVVRMPTLGLLTTSIAGATDAPIIERTWGLLATMPTAKSQFYGPNFSFKEYMKARSWLAGVGIHYFLVLFALVITTPPLRALAKRLVYQPGQGPDLESAKKDTIEYEGIGVPDVQGGADRQAHCRASFCGSMYMLTGLLMSQAALTLLEDGLEFEGGVYTPACLGQPFIDRLHAAGFHFEVDTVPA
ncbi:hypothetical protein GQ53DRAFT_223077 [Thozetella sp. PMI_491]|nr:hypothetical protein GQ53DRAFT_223077 [Thozetella sp. PMI_491]